MQTSSLDEPSCSRTAAVRSGVRPRKASKSRSCPSAHLVRLRTLFGTTSCREGLLLRARYHWTHVRCGQRATSVRHRRCQNGYLVTATHVVVVLARRPLRMRLRFRVFPWPAASATPKILLVVPFPMHLPIPRLPVSDATGRDRKRLSHRSRPSGPFDAPRSRQTQSR